MVYSDCICMNTHTVFLEPTSAERKHVPYMHVIILHLHHIFCCVGNANHMLGQCSTTELYPKP